VKYRNAWILMNLRSAMAGASLKELFCSGYAEAKEGE
jgi:hypothetical protein